MRWLVSVAMVAVLLAAGSCSVQAQSTSTGSKPRPMYLVATTPNRNTLQVFKTTGSSPVSRVGKQVSFAKFGPYLRYTAVEGRYAFSVVFENSSTPKNFLVVTDIEKSQPVVVKSAIFYEQKPLKGCGLASGNMAVQKIGSSKYRIYAVNRCSKNFKDKLYVVRYQYDLASNSFAALEPNDVYLLPTNDQDSVLHIKAFRKGDSETAYVALRTVRKVKITKDPRDGAYYLYGTANLYKLKDRKVALLGIEARQPSQVEVGQGGPPVVVAAAISSPDAFYTIWRQTCGTRDGANHCNYVGNATEQVMLTGKKSNKRIGGVSVSGVNSVGALALCTSQPTNQQILYRIGEGATSDPSSGAPDGSAASKLITFSAYYTARPKTGFKTIGILPKRSDFTGKDYAGTTGTNIAIK